eukprot:gene9027-10697_t
MYGAGSRQGCILKCTVQNESRCRQHIVLNKHHTSETFVMLPKAVLPPEGAKPLNSYKWESCAMVGNSGTLMHGRAYGSLINAHDVVMRINQ